MKRAIALGLLAGALSNQAYATVGDQEPCACYWGLVSFYNSAGQYLRSECYVQYQGKNSGMQTESLEIGRGSDSGGCNVGVCSQFIPGFCSNITDFYDKSQSVVE